MRGVPVRRLTGWLAPVFVSAILVAAPGCREDAESPTAADSGATLDVAATAGLSFRQMSAGPAHSCGVTPDYQAYCWGSNDFGALGNGTDNPSRTPVAVNDVPLIVAATPFTSTLVTPSPIVPATLITSVATFAASSGAVTASDG